MQNSHFILVKKSKKVSFVSIFIDIFYILSILCILLILSKSSSLVFFHLLLKFRLVIYLPTSIYLNIIYLINTPQLTQQLKKKVKSKTPNSKTKTILFYENNSILLILHQQ